MFLLPTPEPSFTFGNFGSIRGVLNGKTTLCETVFLWVRILVLGLLICDVALK